VSERLRFATLNVWALPAGIARHVAPRMEAIARRLGELELDVAALQEVWTPSARSALVAGGRRAGLAHAWHRREAFGGSGLLLLSRRPLGDPLFSPYTLRGLPQRIHHGDYWSGKGFVIATLETAAGPLALLDTHLHARYTRPVDEYRGIRTGQVIELAAGLSIPEIFEKYGEQYFRDGERRVIRRLLDEGPMVLATGGGAFMAPETRALIHERAVSVWLKADVDVLAERVARRDTLPLLRSGDPKQILERLAQERDPVYAQADVTILSDDGPHSDVVTRILKAVNGVARTPGAGGPRVRG